jgi:hypothetical protein
VNKAFVFDIWPLLVLYSYTGVVFFKKAIGGDGILAKIVKNYKSYIAPQLTALVNLSIENNCFPDKLKEAQVTVV